MWCDRQTVPWITEWVPLPHWLWNVQTQSSHLQNFVIPAYFSRGDKGKLCWKVFSSRPAWSSENGSGVVGKADSCASSCFIAGEVFAGRGCTNSFHAGWPQPACLVWEMCSALLLADSWAPAEVAQCVQCAVCCVQNGAGGQKGGGSGWSQAELWIHARNVFTQFNQKILCYSNFHTDFAQILNRCQESCSFPKMTRKSSTSAKNDMWYLSWPPSQYFFGWIGIGGPIYSIHNSRADKHLLQISTQMFNIWILYIYSLHNILWWHLNSRPAPVKKALVTKWCLEESDLIPEDETDSSEDVGASPEESERSGAITEDSDIIVITSEDLADVDQDIIAAQEDNIFKRNVVIRPRKPKYQTNFIWHTS